MMNKKNLTFLLALVVLIAVMYGFSRSSNLEEEIVIGETIEEIEYVIDEKDFLSDDLVEDISISSLSSAEEEGLVLMREEEKLARDVYITLYDIWGLKIFSNISSSEQTHTDAVENLLERYGINDPVENDEVGIFTNPIFTELYNDLVSQGSESLEDALIVGATIEDLDIFDLQTLIAETDNEDILVVYDNLVRGSENHMRAFARQLESRGVSYTAQFLSESEINAIIK